MPCRRECPVFLCGVLCWVSAPRFCKGGELYRLRGLRVRPGGVRWRLSAWRGCELPYCSDMAKLGSPQVRLLHPNRHLTVHHRGPYVHRASGNFVAKVHYREVLQHGSVDCGLLSPVAHPLPSVTRQAILGQVPIAVHHPSGSFGAGAHCHPSLVRQFRGKCPLPFITRQAILGQVPIAIRCSSGDFWGKCPLLGGAIFTRLIASRVAIAGAHVPGQFHLQRQPHVRSSSPFSPPTFRFSEIDVCFSIKGSFLREDSGLIFVYVVATSFIVNHVPFRRPSGTDPAQSPGPFWRVYL